MSQRQSKKEEELQKQQELQRASSFIKDREFSQLLDPKNQFPITHDSVPTFPPNRKKKAEHL